jgi:plasmid maintenance system antidote protein VapI
VPHFFALELTKTREVFLEPVGITAHALAMVLQVPAPRIHGMAVARAAHLRRHE